MLLSQIVLDGDKIAHHQLTTDEIREYCADVKVLGKAALKYDLNVAVFDLMQCMTLGICANVNHISLRNVQIGD